jgi:SAM-dependent methyltransferase
MKSEQLVFPAVLDACCGSRMMWFDKNDPRALFIDKRAEVHENTDVTHPGRSPCVVAPDVVADFTQMPFADAVFRVVVFDPPHITASRSGKQGRFRKIYGVLPNDWQALLRAGFSECFRVLRPQGLLVFKWSEHCYPLKDVLALTPHKPLFGHRTTRSTHWYVFLKETAC